MKKLPLNILQELESDDELPVHYNDVTILPAYLDNNRFDEIKFPWVNNINKSTEDSVSVSHDKILRHKGVLKGQDLYCLKSLESIACSSTLIWLVNFLLYKDLQSHYSYLKSCLVDDLISTGSQWKKCNSEIDKTDFKERFEIVIKF